MSLKRKALWFLVSTLVLRRFAPFAEHWGRRLRCFFSLSNLFGEAVATWWRMRKLR